MFQNRLERGRYSLTAIPAEQAAEDALRKYYIPECVAHNMGGDHYNSHNTRGALVLTPSFQVAHCLNQQVSRTRR
jgi:hypothetical protein